MNVLSSLSSYLKRSFPPHAGQGWCLFFRYRGSMPIAVWISGQRYCAAALMSWYVGFIALPPLILALKQFRRSGRFPILRAFPALVAPCRRGGLVTGSTTKAKSNTQKHQQGAIKIPAETVGFIGLFHGFILCSAPVFQNINLIKSISYENTRAKFALCRLK